MLKFQTFMFALICLQHQECILWQFLESGWIPAKESGADKLVPRI